MCQILLQVYACDHKKPICNTPCLRALATSTSNPFVDPSLLATPKTPISPVYQASDTPTPTRTRRHLFTVGSVPSPVSPQHPSQEAQYPRDPNNFNNFGEDSGDFQLTPSYCTIPRVKLLSPSKYPCLTCYMQPPWEGYRARWVGEYKTTHPGTQPEDLQELAGVEQIPARVGLINVAREMNKLSVEVVQGKGEQRK